VTAALLLRATVRVVVPLVIATAADPVENDAVGRYPLPM